MLKWLKGFRHRMIVRRYVREMGPAIKKSYGASKFYTPEQLRMTATERRFPMSHIGYAWAIYFEEKSFDVLRKDLGETCDYQAMRQEVGDLCFDGRSDFTVPEVIAYGEARGGGGSHASSGNGNGGNGGGNGGGD